MFMYIPHGICLWVLGMFFRFFWDVYNQRKGLVPLHVHMIVRSCTRESRKPTERNKWNVPWGSHFIWSHRIAAWKLQKLHPIVTAVCVIRSHLTSCLQKASFTSSLISCLLPLISALLTWSHPFSSLPCHLSLSHPFSVHLNSSLFTSSQLLQEHET